MDLFLLNEGRKAGTSSVGGKLLAVAALGIASLYMIAKTLAPSDEEQEDEQRVAHKPAGIINQGNTCFVNSLLQALASLRSFEENLKEVMESLRGRPDRHEELLLQLAAVMRKINGEEESISVEHLLALIDSVKAGLINLEQQDAHELYAALVGSFQEVVNRRKTLNLSNSIKLQEQVEIENRLIGFTKSFITCTTCKNETAIKIHPFYDLSLEIRPPYVVDIRSALIQFQREQRIDSWTCTNCTLIHHVRRLKEAVSRLQGPHRLQLSAIAEEITAFLQKGDLLELDIGEVNTALGEFVVRFSQKYQEMEGDPQRQAVFVEMQGMQTTITKRTVIAKYPKVLVVHLKQLTINPITGEPQLLRKHIGFDQTLSVQLKGREKSYVLTSLLTHVGNESMGHYYTFRRQSRQSGNWFVISDLHSRRCQWEYVKSSRAYMLFYEAE